MFKHFLLRINERTLKQTVLDKLVELNYSYQPKVSEQGDFTHRGSIIDIFPVAFNWPIRLEFNINQVESIKSFDPHSQKTLWGNNKAIILPFKRKVSIHPDKLKLDEARKAHIKLTDNKDIRLDDFLNLEFGDYVVHEEHGIGKFVGIKKIKLKDKLTDHLIIRYLGGDSLYVPLNEINLVSRYMAFEGLRPKMSRLGSSEWQRIKDRVRRAVRVVALDLLQTQAARSSLSGFKFSADTDWQRDFEATFPYEETPDQKKSWIEVKKDMESDQPMDRLLCGDVGYGKTEVAMRAAFKAVMDNKQVAILVPTTILAVQHYFNFSQRVSSFPVNVAMLSRFNSKGENKNIVEATKKGAIDILIGTHRLLGNDVQFKDLGLIIIDEEQRFGVRAKEKLKKLRLLADILTLTATPIPRTLYMSLTGIKDISVIDTPPKNRLAVETIVSEYDEHLAVQAVEQEVKRGGQVYFVHNRIEDIDKVALRLKKDLDERINIAIAHGRMHSNDLEKVTLSFLKRKIDCLVTTTIIESGIDIPNANTLIVDRAEHFGLSDLHQLRGRVGRFNRQAYAYLFISKEAVLNPDAKKRLKAIEEFSQLGSGFQIAMQDLEIRGAGNLLGTEQHGYIMVVGFDLYSRLLRQAVDGLHSLRKEKVHHASN
jgi:transcription-repair coupling factor (superfamily II helicase)